MIIGYNYSKTHESEYKEVLPVSVVAEGAVASSSQRKKKEVLQRTSESPVQPLPLSPPPPLSSLLWK